MIMLRWRGAIRAADAERYLEHQARTGVKDYRETPGNLGVFVLSRPLGDLVEKDELVVHHEVIGSDVDPAVPIGSDRARPAATAVFRLA